MVLKVKEILENEITRILESKYGFYRDGKIIELNQLKNLSVEEILIRGSN